jgi:hypothetical protein
MNSLVTVAPPAFPVVPSVLGENPRRIPVGGKIRAGIKVLTTKAAQNPTAKAIYDKGVEQGRKFEDIEAEIAKAVPDLKQGALVPKNVPYFTVRRGDFAMPEVADMILEQYGEDRDDGVKRLYRFPVIFPIDNWQAVMPHALECYGAAELKFWSQYSSDGSVRLCMTHAPVPTDPIAKRPIRIFGGRKQVTRPENDGRCEPEKCKEYQMRQCNLSGSFIFFIPGIPSVNAIELPTNSFYSMNNARQKLEMIAFMRGGRISGYLEGKQTFWITKKLHEVAMIDPESGRPKRVAQWLIELEANIDVARLVGSREDEETRLREAERALQVVNGHALVAEELRPSSEATVGSNRPTGVSIKRLREPNACSRAYHRSTKAQSRLRWAQCTRPKR